MNGYVVCLKLGFPGGSVVKNLPAVQEPLHLDCTQDLGSIPGSGRSSKGGQGNAFQYSCLENPRHRRAR